MKGTLYEWTFFFFPAMTQPATLVYEVVPETPWFSFPFPRCQL